MPNSTRALPDALALTERSRKFYNGTYTWDSEGFTDDLGVHRAFDCYDPLAHAPTPLPPVFESDEEGMSEDVEKVGDESRVLDTTASTASESYADELAEELAATLRGATSDEKIRGILTESRKSGVRITLDECYRLCGLQENRVEDTKARKKGLTPPTSPATTHGVPNQSDQKHVRQTTPKGTLDAGAESMTPTRPPSNKSKTRLLNSSPVSDLSDCLSIVSDGGVENQIKDGSVAPSLTTTKHESDINAAKELKPARKTTGRGVAQKVVRQKSRATSTTQPTTQAVPTSVSSQSDTYMNSLDQATLDAVKAALGSTSRRRSARQAKTRGGR